MVLKIENKLSKITINIDYVIAVEIDKDRNGVLNVDTTKGTHHIYFEDKESLASAYIAISDEMIRNWK